MKNFFKIAGCMAIALASFTSFNGNASADTTTIMDLDAGEPYEAMIFHAKHLWIGKSRKDFNTNYRIDVVDRNDKVLETLKINHAIEHLYPYGENSVIAVGTAPEPNLRHYTIIKVVGEKFQVKDHAIPANAWGMDWLGTINGKEYFSDFGGNSQDEEGSSNPNIPMQTIFSVDPSGRAVYSKIRLRSPMNGIRIADELYIVRFYNLGDTRRNVYRLNLKTGQFVDMFDQPRQRLTDIIPLDNNLLAVSEAGGDRVNLIDRSTRELKKEIAIEGAPKSMQKIGQCLVVGSELSRQVNLVSVKDLSNPQIVGTLDFSTYGGHFRGLRTVAVDEQTGRVYGRSAYACNPMLQDCSKSWNSIVVGSKADAELLKAQCLN
jgi:hypothetical protein